jgi:ankyrin repeat protein
MYLFSFLNLADHKDIVVILLSKGADVNFKDTNGLTA